MVAAINKSVGAKVAVARDDGTVRMKVLPKSETPMVDLLAQIELVEIKVDSPARVVINERTGTVVMGAAVQLSPVAVAHGGLSIEVQRKTDVVQPNPLAMGKTVVVDDATIKATEQSGRLTLVEGVTIGQLVSALNGMGVKPRDLIQILVTIKAAGALHAEISSL